MNINKNEEALKKPVFLSRRRFLIWATSIFIVVVVVGLSLSFKWFGNRHIKSLVISGNFILPEHEIRAKIQDSLINTRNQDISLINIKKILSQNPFIEQVELMHSSSDGITVQIKEREPAASLVFEDGNLGFVDKSGFLLPYKFQERFPDLPVIRNICSDSILEPKVLEQCLSLIKNLRNSARNSMIFFISEILYDKEKRDFTLIATNNNIKIYLGRFENMSQKIESICNFWFSGDGDKSSGSIAYIDLRWENRIITGSVNTNTLEKKF